MRIPIGRGIFGLRILLVRADSEDSLAAVRTAGDLNALRIGVIPSWAEARIVRYNGLSATDGTSLDGLWKMLEHGHIDALDRSAIEAGPELTRYGAEFPDVVLDRHLALFSPLPSYFWFSKSAGGPLLAERVRVGLEAMVVDGSLDALFHKHFDSALRGLELDRRSILYLDNPDLGPADSVTDSRYWLFTKRD